MQIQVKSAPTTLNSDIGGRMVGVIFNDIHDDSFVPGTYFIPVEKVLQRMPNFEHCAEFSPFMEGIYLPKQSCVVLRA